MLEELENMTDHSVKMHTVIPARQHRIYKDNFLNKTVSKVIQEIRRHKNERTN
jgi:hypothetical protein